MIITAKWFRYSDNLWFKSISEVLYETINLTVDLTVLSYSENDRMNFIKEIKMKMYNQMDEGKVAQTIMLYMFMGYSVVYLSIYEISRRGYLRKVFSTK